jgi:predicted Zn-dependent protease with MMP-like domain
LATWRSGYAAACKAVYTGSIPVVAFANTQYTYGGTLYPVSAAGGGARREQTMSGQRHYSEQEFEALVSSALDELPIEFQHALEHVAIVVSDRGAENHAYGMYVGSRSGGTPFFGGGGLPDEILIFRDTLVRDFGDDRERLRRHVIQTVRHEVGHHLGFDETGVRKLGL